MGKIKCPHCGSNDCKVREITLSTIADVGVEFGVQAIKSIFTGKMDYQRALDNASQRTNPNNSKKRSYRCKTCGYTWDNGL